MSKLRVLGVGLLVMAVLTLGFPLAASAQFYPPALKKCTVYEDDVLVGAGVLVEAYVGDEAEPRAEALTNADGVAIMSVPTYVDDFDTVRALSFDVNGQVAVETPDVDLTLNFQEVDLHVTAGTRVETWDMAFGLDQDPSAVNFYLYPNDAVQVTLADIAGTAPPEVSIVWHYGGPVLGWTWWVPLVGESTLLTLDPGEIYIGVATTATSWDIPQ